MPFYCLHETRWNWRVWKSKQITKKPNSGWTFQNKIIIIEKKLLSDHDQQSNCLEWNELFRKKKYIGSSFFSLVGACIFIGHSLKENEMEILNEDYKKCLNRLSRCLLIFVLKFVFVLKLAIDFFHFSRLPTVTDFGFCQGRNFAFVCQAEDHIKELRTIKNVVFRDIVLQNVGCRSVDFVADVNCLHLLKDIFYSQVLN